ncbi:MAG: DUF2312 domain-containing protein [Bosea sp.]|nr:DUF2312 domain-containing protein [Bosea sp. (in: a-proteobacteria)]
MSDDQIKTIIERVQRLQEEKRTIEDDIKEVYAEARANGYDVKVLRAVVKHLGKDQSEVEEFDAIFDLYLQAFKNGLAGAGAGRATYAHEEADQSKRREVHPDDAESDDVDRSASAQPHKAEGEPAIPTKAGDAGTGQAVWEPDASGIGQPSGAGTGSAVRAGAPVERPKAAPIDLTIPAFLDRRQQTRPDA